LVDFAHRAGCELARPCRPVIVVAMSFLDELGEFLESVRAGEVAALRVSSAAIAGHLQQLARWFQDAADDEPSATHELTYDRWLHRCTTGLLEVLYERVAQLFPEPPLPLARLVDLALAELIDDLGPSFLRRARLNPVEVLGSVGARMLSIAGEGAAAA